MANKLNALEYRDSIAIVHVVRTWQDRRFEYFSDKKSEPWNLKNGKIEIIILRGFYGPDKKKIVTWFTEKIPNNDGYSLDSGYYYNSNCIIGVRDDTNKIFKFMLFEQQMCEAAELTWIIECMSNYFFSKMKEDYTRLYARYYNSYYGGKLHSLENIYTDKSIYQEYGYNLQDKEFWDRSLLWYKGSRIKGYENEELIEWATEPDLHNSDSNRIFIKYPKIEYPDLILKLYPESYKEVKKEK
ncbi:MAG: hypothetical protein A2X64_08090 [Ignavibacteria bacterium GWF2_33_9]|nr:MAG: hypothetical protein A2X64_08090 [Ignavibacteria bacterium GWF2_33_9]